MLSYFFFLNQKARKYSTMFTKLSDEEKLDCFIYMGKFLSKDEGIATIQCEMIERVLDIIIKECDYRFNGVERDGKIFYLDWLNKDLTPEYCDTMIGYIQCGPN